MEEKEINRTPYANSVFEQPWWLDLVAPGKWDEVTVKDGERVIARLPYVLDNGIISNPVYTQTLGIWLDDSLKTYQRGNAHLHAQKEVIAELLSALPKHKGMSVTFDSATKYILPFRWHGFRIEPTFSYRINDLSDMAAVTANISKSTAKKLTPARKKLTVKEDCPELVELMVALQNKTFARQGRSNPNDNALTARIMSGAIEAGHGKIIMACGDDGEPHSASFLLYDDKVCYDLISGQDPAHKNDNSNELVLDESIKFAATVSKAFDFEGSMVEGIEHFFSKFGGDQIVNYHVSRQSALRDIMDVMKPRIKNMIGYKN